MNGILVLTAIGLNASQKKEKKRKGNMMSDSVYHIKTSIPIKIAVVLEFKRKCKISRVDE